MLDLKQEGFLILFSRTGTDTWRGLRANVRLIAHVGLPGPPGDSRGQTSVLRVPLRIPRGAGPVLSESLGSIFTTKTLKFHEAYS